MKCHYLVFIDRIILPQILSNYSKFAIRAVTRALNIGGGGAYSYIIFCPINFFWKLTLKTIDFKRN